MTIEIIVIEKYIMGGEGRNDKRKGENGVD
jgi:hypothetical protein